MATEVTENVTLETSTKAWTSENESTVSNGTSITPIYVIYTLGEILIAILSAFGNALVIYVIAKERRLHTITNYFIVGLAAADFLVGILGIPFALVSFNGMPVGAYGCLLFNSMIVILTQISIFGLLAIAVERFIAIRFPFQYHNNFTSNIAWIVISIYWSCAVLVGLVPMFGWNKTDTYKGDYCAFMDIIDMNYMVYFNFFGFVLIPLFMMFGIYCYMFHVVHEQTKQISSLQIPSNPTQNSQQDNFSLKKELRAAKWFAFVIGFFAFCWMPIHIINTLGIYNIVAPYELLVASILLSHLNSAVNPILYAYSNHKFKTAMKKAFGLRISIEDLDSLGYSQGPLPVDAPIARSPVAAVSYGVQQDIVRVKEKQPPPNAADSLCPVESTHVLNAHINHAFEGDVNDERNSLEM